MSALIRYGQEFEAQPGHPDPQAAERQIAERAQQIMQRYNGNSSDPAHVRHARMCAKYSVQHGLSVEEAAQELGDLSDQEREQYYQAQSLPRRKKYSPEEAHREAFGDLTQEGMQAALNYQATHAGVSFSEALGVIRNQAHERPQRYFMKGPPGVEQRLPPGSKSWGTDADAAVRDFQRQAEERRRQVREADDLRKQINDLAQREGIDIALVYQAAALYQEGEARSLEAALEMVKNRIRNAREFGNHNHTGTISITSLQPAGRNLSPR